MSLYHYSEIFHSIQGEGHYTGVPTVWLRFFLCNLQCNGFGQIDPTNEDAWDLPFKDFDVDEKDENGNFVYNKMSDLPVWHKGCDSSYSWSKKFKRLQDKGTSAEILQRMIDETGQSEEMALNNHFCFTGGEPMMKHAQKCSLEMMNIMHKDYGRLPPSVTYETNGTQKLTTEFFYGWHTLQQRGAELFMSVSPKLWSVAGEKADKAIKPDVVAEYAELTRNGQLKFVVNGTQESWDEVEDVISQFRRHGVDYPVWIMNAGATFEGQQGEIEGHNPESIVCNEALKRGYNYSTRAHVHIYGNQIGT